eukprot:TRINITY_DN1529_c0_g1_i1.p1 TRINITY_DN1529_c0_g1~~TRINITY_DN1529_c0_g1_i1.p1  ORF type:complete len:555 (-),score=105.79 TRINITY_DN1529_c0_g1_i1:99-1763(-)
MEGSDNPLLNHDTLRTVFSMMPRHALYGCLCTCKEWNKVASGNLLWQSWYERDFGDFQPLGAGEMVLTQQPEKPRSSSNSEYSESYYSSSVDSEEEEMKAEEQLREVKAQAIAAITDMGFSVTAAERAWFETKKNVEAAVDYVLTNAGNPILERPLESKILGVDREAFVELEAMGFPIPRKALVLALMMHDNRLDKAVDWIMSEPSEIEVLKEEESNDDPDEPMIDPKELKEEDHAEGHWMARYKESLESTLVTTAYIKGKWVKASGGGSSLTRITITSGFRVPEPFPIPFPPGYSTGLFVEFDVSQVEEAERARLPFLKSYMLTFITASSEREPKTLDDIPIHIKCIVEGNTLHCAYFYNPEAKNPQMSDLKLDNGIDFFMSIGKKKWLHSWKSPHGSLCPSSVSPGQRFMLFLLYKNSKEFRKKYSRFQGRRALKTKKKRVGGFHTNPHIKSRRMPVYIGESAIKWTTLSHVGLNFQQEFPVHWVEATMDDFSTPIFMNSISIKNRQGSGGVIIYEGKPKFKRIFSVPYLEEEDKYHALMKIEKETEDYWDY